MTGTVILEWTYEPHNFFEEPFVFKQDGYDVAVEKGEIIATLPNSVFEATPDLTKNLHENLKFRFQAVQLHRHQRYTLSDARMTKVRPDGKRDYHLKAGTGEFILIGEKVDFVLKDSNGNIKVDTRRERIENEQNFQNRASDLAKTDPCLLGLLNSHNAAVDAPDHELVHLYEIRDALAKNFGGEQKARAALNISDTAWSRFGHLCNHADIAQGRHCGKSNGALRNASQTELEEARKLTRSMIEAYICYLEASQKADFV